MVSPSSEMLRSSDARETTYSASTQLELGDSMGASLPIEGNKFDVDDVENNTNVNVDDKLDDDGLDDTFADAYFADLLSHSLDRLSKEPQVLEAERQRARARGLEAALTESGKAAPPAAASALSSAAEALRDAASAATSAASALPRAADAADAFARAAPSLRRRMEQDARARRGCPAAAELAEAPALAAAAARGGGFDEALALRALLSRAALLHPTGGLGGSAGTKPSGAVVLDAAGGGAAASAATGALLERLSSGPLPLAESLRCVGYLRRLQSSGGKRRGAAESEAALRAAFLRARGQWLDASVAAATTPPATTADAPNNGNSPLEAIKRITDVHRAQLFDVATQYRAVFGGGSVGVASSSTAACSAAEADLSAWLTSRLASYLDALGPALLLLKDGASLRAALDHASFAAASLGGRATATTTAALATSSSSGAGADARAALPPLFERAALSMLARNLSQAVSGFEAGLASHSWVVLPVPPAAPPSTTSTSTTTLLPPPPPPYSLLAHAPVARLSNAFSAALNDLRAFAPRGATGKRAASIFGDALVAAAAAAASAAARVSLSGGGRNSSSASAAAASALLEATEDVALPHAAKCFACVYPEHAAVVERALVEIGGRNGRGGGASSSAAAVVSTNA